MSHPLSLFDFSHHHSSSPFLRADVLTFISPLYHVFPNSQLLGSNYPLLHLSSCSPSYLSTFPPHTPSVNPLTTLSPSRVRLPAMIRENSDLHTRINLNDFSDNAQRDISSVNTPSLRIVASVNRENKQEIPIARCGVTAPPPQVPQVLASQPPEQVVNPGHERRPSFLLRHPSSTPYERQTYIHTYTHTHTQSPTASESSPVPCFRDSLR